VELFIFGKNAVAGYQLQLNHAGDENLKKLLKESIDAGQEEAKQNAPFDMKRA
jgi:hypothetical protein